MLTALVASDGGAPSNDRAKPPQAKPSPRAELEAALAKGASPAELQHWAATADGLLMTLAADPAAAEAVRGRALAGLAYARNGRAHAFLENFVIEKTPSSDRVDRLLVRRAAISLGWQGGPRVVEVLAPLLDSADAEVRVDAAAALGLTRAREAEAPLRARLAVESDAGVKRQLEAAVKAVTAAR
ncbi:MAG TPA: HEAT repeat domain-containing protein [Polyangia bacterium]|nr:HEAT repeat domain-containing protein [Polyangia bacterium]